ncbi:hypothetical protein [Streptomyces sp. NPDC015131]|uniref:hypothetical protein n=1 Tax=Streptomyces sp. NPDC015131 TaxID=3364941 RepID=UPI003701D567
MYGKSSGKIVLAVSAMATLLIGVFWMVVYIATDASFPLGHQNVTNVVIAFLLVSLSLAMIAYVWVAGEPREHRSSRPYRGAGEELPRPGTGVSRSGRA